MKFFSKSNFTQCSVLLIIRRRRRRCHLFRHLSLEVTPRWPAGRSKGKDRMTEGRQAGSWRKKIEVLRFTHAILISNLSTPPPLYALQRWNRSRQRNTPLPLHLLRPDRPHILDPEDRPAIAVNALNAYVVCSLGERDATYRKFCRRWLLSPLLWRIMRFSDPVSLSLEVGGIEGEKEREESECMVARKRKEHMTKFLQY